MPALSQVIAWAAEWSGALSDRPVQRVRRCRAPRSRVLKALHVMPIRNNTSTTVMKMSTSTGSSDATASLAAVEAIDAGSIEHTSVVVRASAPMVSLAPAVCRPWSRDSQEGRHASPRKKAGDPAATLARECMRLFTGDTRFIACARCLLGPLTYSWRGEIDVLRRGAHPLRRFRNGNSISNPLDA